mgnify:CR=1 FL=1
MKKEPTERKPIMVNAKILRALRHIAAKQDIRYYLNGVQFKAGPGGKEYVATDGHKIGAFHEGWEKDEHAQDLDIIIPRAVCAGIKLPKKTMPAWLRPSGTHQWILESGGDEPYQIFHAIDGKFPEWQKVIPDKCRGTAGAYNWNYLAQFGACLKEVVGDGFSVCLKQNGEEAAIVTHPTASFLGVLMPMRMGDFPLPGWAADAQKANVARKTREQSETEARGRASVPA